MIDTIINADCLQGMKAIDDNTIDCCVTSPPYWGLRDYGIAGQIGLEETIDEYVEKMVDIFREVRRVLKPEGTLWLNLGDSYAGSGMGAANYPDSCTIKQASNAGAVTVKGRAGIVPNGLKPKDLMGMPWRVAFALQADGWWLRQDIIWHKPDPMPQSMTDRCTTAHEYMFLLSKSRRYYYDHEIVKVPIANSTLKDTRFCDDEYEAKRVDRGYPGQASKSGGLLKRKNATRDDTGKFYRNKRSVWTVTTAQYKEAHFATFPEKLIEPCILAGCPKGGIVFDPFMGSGTVAKVAIKHGRHYIGIEINPEYINLANKRIANVQLKFA